MKTNYGMSQEELENASNLELLGQDLLNFLYTLDDSREVAIAAMKLEECILWAAKAIVKPK